MSGNFDIREMIDLCYILTQAVQEMKMLTTSVLNIKWTLRGKPKLPPASALGGEVVLSVTSVFTLNQISGQVVEHEEEWDLSASDPLSQAYFWTTRLAFSTIEAGKDSAEEMKGMTNALNKGKDDDKNSYYPDPSGDPRKVMYTIEKNVYMFQVILVSFLFMLHLEGLFLHVLFEPLSMINTGDSNSCSVLVQFFQVEDNPQKDLYQIGFVIACIYLLVQFLREIL